MNNKTKVWWKSSEYTQMSIVGREENIGMLGVIDDRYQSGIDQFVGRIGGEPGNMRMLSGEYLSCVGQYITIMGSDLEEIEVGKIG